MIAAVEMSRLAIARGDRSLFQGLDARLEAGQAVALTGANGAGKTSLLRALAGFIRPAEGTVRFTDAAGAEIEAETARRRIHLLGHLDGLRPGARVRDELAFHAAWLGGGAAEPAIARLALDPLLELEVRKLSAGQRRRVALARLVAAPRPLWLLDEPGAPLDARWRGVLAELIAEHTAAGGLALIATHEPAHGLARTLELSA